MNDRLARSIVCGVLRRLRHGSLLLIEDGRGPVRLGDGAAGGPAVVLEVHSPAFYGALLRGSIGLSDAYMNRLFDCTDLPGLARLAGLNMPQLDAWRRALRPLVALPQAGARWLERNTPARSRRQIAAHYDLGNELFGLMLDDTMMYSCAIFESADASLHEAQLAKLDRICRKLSLGPDDHVLEIGTGWGGFAIHAASRYGCRVTTTTISAEQLELARRRVASAGVADRVTLLRQDYRELSGVYDKIVSIEMIEAVGWQYFDTFFARCGALLAPDGAMLLQSITIDDRAYEVEKATKSFANTHIFPGGCLPSVEVLARSVARTRDLRAISSEDITAHYVRTLRCWRESFLGQLDRVRALGYDGRFERMWELYLAYCEGGFAARRIGTVQVLLAKPGYVAGRAAAAAQPRALGVTAGAACG